MKKLWKLSRTVLAIALVFSLTLGMCANGLTVFAAGNTDAESRKEAILKELFGEGVTTEEAFNKLLAETETMNGYVNRPFCYVPDNNSFYVALGDDVPFSSLSDPKQKTSYVDLLAESLGLDENGYLNLAANQKKIQDVTADIANHQADIKKADLITLSFNNFSATYFMCKYMAGQTSRVTEADWKDLVGEENMPLVKDLLNEMFQTLKDKDLSNFDGYDLEGGLECYAFAFLSNAIHQANIIEAIREINTDAVIVLVGTYNDLEGISLDVNGEMMHLGDMMRDLVNASNLLSTRNAAAYKRVAYVDAPNVVTTLDKNASKYTTPKQYVLAIVGRQGLPTADGHKYISDQIFNTMTDTCSHIWDEGTVTTAPTCNKEGVKKFTCTWCGHTKTETMAATGNHTPATREENYKAPSCEVDGSYDLVTYCTVCSEVISIEAKKIPATGEHNYVSEVTVEASCETAGLMTYTCTLCGDSYTQEIAPTGHDYKFVVTKPTCTEGGYTTYTCAVCGHSYVADKTAALDHYFGEWTVTKAPSCTEPGEEYHACARCGHVETREVPPSEHTYEVVVTAPTCTKGGYTTYSCACGYSYIADEVAPLDHAWVSETKEVTCCEDGMTTTTCTNCGEVTQEHIPATGEHQLVYTDLENGVSHRVVCGNSGKELIADETHNFVDGVCDKCGAVETCKHQWDAGKVTKEANCCTEGLIHYTCTLCGEGRDAVVPVNPDVHTGVTHVENAKEPTCMTPGYSGDQVCECGRIVGVGVEIPVVDHVYEETVTPPTCTEDGYTTYTCVYCGDSFTEVTDWAMGHIYDAGVVTKAPTATENGEKVHTCTVCGEQTIKVIPHPCAEGTHVFYEGFCDICGKLDTKHLSAAFIRTLQGLDWMHELDAYYMIAIVNRIYCDFGEFMIVPADEYEAMIDTYFVLTEQVLSVLRGSEDWNLTYNAEDHTYTIGNIGGMGGIMAPRYYAGYVIDGDTYKVYYANITYAYLQDALPEGVNEWEYAESLGYPETIEYEGVVYEAGPEGYAAVVSYDKFGKVYTVEVNGDVVRILSCELFTEAEMPTEFDGDVSFDIPEDGSVSIPENDCFEDGAQVKVEKLEAGELFKAVVEAMKDYAEKYTAFEFTAQKDGVAVQPSGKLAVTFMIPADYSTNVKVYYLNAEGKLEELVAVVDAANRTVTVELTHFSTYILVDEDSKIQPDVQMGDINGDGRVNSRDARLLLRYLAGMCDENEVIFLDAADFNADGRLNVRDARALLAFLAGLG